MCYDLCVCVCVCVCVLLMDCVQGVVEIPDMDRV